jgi:glycosyltransferase involved in cell wall biosynthesis
MSECPMLSVVVPCFNEAEVIDQTHQRLGIALAAITPGHEIIYVDDGSVDATAEHLHRIQLSTPEVKVALLSATSVLISIAMAYCQPEVHLSGRPARIYRLHLQ